MHGGTFHAVGDHGQAAGVGFANRGAVDRYPGAEQLPWVAQSVSNRCRAARPYPMLRAGRRAPLTSSGSGLQVRHRSPDTRVK
jgi:hypothetical protein